MIPIEEYLKNYSFSNNLVSYNRRKAREVFIGDVPLGGNHPIRIQSMTTAPTMDTRGTVEETIRLIESGCDYVRITAPSIKEAKNLEEIKRQVRDRGYSTPLIADIHFTPNAAEIAARLVEKVRVNPGNYADKKKFEVFEISDDLYYAELERIRKKFIPLIDICKEYGTAMRIGTNHGSLSDRIMNRYGDTPVGMVESAMEFLRICEERGYHQIVLSMKASNPKVMVEAYRLLVAKMDEEGMNYPLHLGVTEAGDGEEARIKSAAGIGTLLEDGLGDTVRVSLTEAPENEAPVAKKIVERYDGRPGHKPVKQLRNNPIKIENLKDYNPFVYEKRNSTSVINIGKEEPARVIADLSQKEGLRELTLKAVDYHYEPATDKWKLGSHAADYVYLGKNIPGFSFPTTLGKIFDFEIWRTLSDQSGTYPLLNLENLGKVTENLPAYFLKASLEKLSIERLKEAGEKGEFILVLEGYSEHRFPELRKAFIDLKAEGIECPVIISGDYSGLDDEAMVLYSATDTAGLMIDGFGDGIWLKKDLRKDESPVSQARFLNRLSFQILQSAGTRISKTEFIACPSCGRTQFDLQKTTTRIKSRTDHLKGVKIAIMGCIVNGPGEMADADYGYVGTGPGKITLYKGKEVVKRNLTSDVALDELIGLIKDDGNWKDSE